MTYTPNNAQVFYTAYSGAIASMATSGWIVDPIAADYESVIEVAGAYAKAVDTAWVDPAGLSAVQFFTMLSTSQSQFRNFAPAPLNGSQGDILKNPANWSLAANAVIALADQSEVYMGAQGIAPAFFPGIGALPVPEDYLLPGETIASVTAAKAWEGPINRMLLANDTCACSPNRLYEISGDIVVNTNNTVYGQQAITKYAAGSGNHSMWTMTNVTDVNLYGIRADGNLQGAGGYFVANCFQIVTSSRVVIEGCYGYEFGLTYGSGVEVYGASYHITINRNTFYKNTVTDGLANGIGLTSNNQARAFITITNNWVYSIADNSDVSAIYVGVALVGSTTDFTMTGNLVQQVGQGFTCGYSGVDTDLQGIIDSNQFYNCAQNGLYNTGSMGSAPRKLIVSNNIYVYCGGGAEFVGRASMWLGGTQLNVESNLIIHSGYKPDGTTRPYHYGSIYTPQTDTGRGGLCKGNIVIHSLYIGISIDGPVNLNLSGNYAESQYPFAIGTSPAGGTFKASMILNENISTIYTGLVGDGFEVSSIVQHPFEELIMNSNRVVGAVAAGSIAFNIGPYVNGALEQNTSIGCNTGFSVATSSAEGLGRTLFIANNTLKDCVDAILATAVAGGNGWLYVLPNRYINCTNKIRATGAGLSRVYEAVMLEPRKVIISAALPAAGSDNWNVGDQIWYSPVTAGICMSYCDVAGDGGAPTHFLSILGV